MVNERLLGVQEEISVALHLVYCEDYFGNFPQKILKIGDKEDRESKCESLG